MFGVIRSKPSSSSSPSQSPSPSCLSSVEWFEEERHPSKLLKEDSLSIYEETLMKLKQGSRRSSNPDNNGSLISQDSMDFELSTNTVPVEVCDETRTGMISCSSDGSCGSVLSSTNQEHENSKRVSIQFLFSKYTSSHYKQGSSPCNNGSETNVSCCSSDSESTGCS